MYRKIFSVSVSDKEDEILIRTQDLCKYDEDYLILFVKTIELLELCLFNCETNKCEKELIDVGIEIIEEAYRNNPMLQVKYITYFKRFCEMLDKPILEGMMTNE